MGQVHDWLVSARTNVQRGYRGPRGSGQQQRSQQSQAERPAGAVRGHPRVLYSSRQLASGPRLAEIPRNADLAAWTDRPPERRTQVPQHRSRPDRVPSGRADRAHQPFCATLQARRRRRSRPIAAWSSTARHTRVGRYADRSKTAPTLPIEGLASSPCASVRWGEDRRIRSYGPRQRPQECDATALQHDRRGHMQPRRDEASVFGRATINAGSPIEYRIDVQLTAWERAKNTTASASATATTQAPSRSTTATSTSTSASRNTTTTTRTPSTTRTAQDQTAAEATAPLPGAGPEPRQAFLRPKPNKRARLRASLVHGSGHLWGLLSTNSSAVLLFREARLPAVAPLLQSAMRADRYPRSIYIARPRAHPITTRGGAHYA